MAESSNNPLLAPSPLPFGAPRFDAIRDKDFVPAFDEAIRAHVAEVEAIAHDPAPPTFDNTLVALEKSGQPLTRVALVFNMISSANTNELIQTLQEDLAPRLAAHADAILLNGPLFARIRSLYARREELALDEESRRLLEYQYDRFVTAGANLPDDDKRRLTALNKEEAVLSARFTTLLLAASRNGALVVRDRNELDGLSQAEIDAAAATAAEREIDGAWVLSLRNTTQQPLLRSLRHRATRERLFRASATRASRGDTNDTRATINRLAEIRAARAALLGQSSHAAWRLRDQMARDPAQVETFLAQLIPPATSGAQTEAAELQALIDARDGGFHLAAWDWDFYADQVRRAKFDVSDDEIRPYFELDRVMQDGVFFAATQLYGLTMIERFDLPTYHSDVRVFDVRDESGIQIGLFYADFFRRDNKNGGAWMDNLLPQSTLIDTLPIICNVCNFSKPPAGQPALLGLDEVLTLFHEFGHALHGFLACQRYPSLSGTAVARDFVELPALFNENWALHDSVLPRYARHQETGAPMPGALADRIRAAARMNQGYALTEILAAAQIDFRWHSLSPSVTVEDVSRFEHEALRSAGLELAAVPPRYDSSYFLHIWANGYDGGYYAYLWAEMLAHDTFSWFREHGGPTRENGRRFRDLILSRGNTRDYAVMFRDFRGRDPMISPMLEFRGITTH